MNNLGQGMGTAGIWVAVAVVAFAAPLAVSAAITTGLLWWSAS